MTFGTHVVLDYPGRPYERYPLRGDPATTAPRQRLAEILARHVVPQDMLLDDAGLVKAVMVRYTRDRGVPLIDPNE